MRTDNNSDRASHRRAKLFDLSGKMAVVTGASRGLGQYMENNA